MIYFDYTATTKPREEVLALYNKINNEYWYNPSSIYKTGIMSEVLYSDSEQKIIEILKLQNKKVVFTSGATEANNLAIYGICNQYLGQNKNVITTKIEHPSVLSCYNDLETKGFKVTYLDVDEKGIINLEQLKNSLNSDTILVSIMWVNNIVGVIEPIEKVIELLKDYPRTKLHVDSVQGMGKLKPCFNLNNVDLLTISSHKINGLKSSGSLIYNAKINLKSVLKGSKQQNGIRPGTMDLSLAATTVKALQMAVNELDKHYEYVKELNDYLRSSLSSCSKIIINSPDINYTPYILNISIPSSESETIIHYLEQFDIYVAAGSACNSKTKKPEKTVLEMFEDEKRAIRSLRISLSYVTTKQEVDELVKRLKQYIEK